MYEEFVGPRLRALRNEKHVTAQQMSYDLNMYDGYISSVESGKNLPSMAQFFKICEYLNITPAFFFDTAVKTEAIGHELEIEISRLTPENRGYLLAFLKSLNKEK